MFPPLWWLTNEVAEVQSAATERRLAEGIYHYLFPSLLIVYCCCNLLSRLHSSCSSTTSSNSYCIDLTQDGKQEDEPEPEQKKGKKKVLGEDMNFLEEDPEGDSFVEWPPEAMFERQARNRVKV